MTIDNNFQTLIKLSHSEIVSKKSKFLGFIYPCNTKKEFIQILENIKKIHKKAKHICFAYRILEKDNITERFNDSTEPKGVAGIKMLQLLRNDNLINCLSIVVRYYGGIKLGKNNLSKCYTESVKKCLNKSSYVLYTKIQKYSVIINYKNINVIDKINNMNFVYLKEIFNNKKNVEEKVLYITVEERNHNKLKQFLKSQNIENAKLINTKIIKKER